MVYKRAYGNSVLSVSSFFPELSVFSFSMMRNLDIIPSNEKRQIYSTRFHKKLFGIDAIESKVCSERDRESPQSRSSKFPYPTTSFNRQRISPYLISWWWLLLLNSNFRWRRRSSSSSNIRNSIRNTLQNFPQNHLDISLERRECFFVSLASSSYSSSRCRRFNFRFENS